MELEIKESANLQDGQYHGVIDHVEFRTDPFEYTDVYIKEIKTGFILKWGAPTSVSEKTKLGKLLAKFVELKVGNKIDPEKVLTKGSEVIFMTINEKVDGHEYARIVDGSIKPLVTTEVVKNRVQNPIFYHEQTGRRDN